jgi:hypothetical protein
VEVQVLSSAAWNSRVYGVKAVNPSFFPTPFVPNTIREKIRETFPSPAEALRGGVTSLITYL